MTDGDARVDHGGEISESEDTHIIMSLPAGETDWAEQGVLLLQYYRTIARNLDDGDGRDDSYEVGREERPYFRLKFRA